MRTTKNDLQRQVARFAEVCRERGLLPEGIGICLSAWSPGDGQTRYSLQAYREDTGAETKLFGTWLGASEASGGLQAILWGMFADGNVGEAVRVLR
jgi:hypothetical protein